MRNPNDITAYRKEKKRKSNMNKVLVTAVLFLAILAVWMFRENIFAPLQGVANRMNTTGINEGFPIVLSGSASFSMSRTDNNFLLLSDTYLYTFTSRGGHLLAHRHNYSRPVQRATNRRILVYNFNGNEFSLFNRSGRVYEVKLDDRIVLAELGENDMAAVVTTSTAFSNILHIYNNSGSWVYRQRFIDEEVNALTFASRNNEIFVATSTVRDGDVECMLYRFRTDTEDDLIWERALPRGAWALQVRENGGYVTVLADNMLMSFDANTGQPAGSYNFDSGQLVKDIYGDEFNLVILRDYVTGKLLFITLDLQSNVINTEIMPFEQKQVEIFGEIVYTLTGEGLMMHDMHLNQLGLIELEDEFRDFVTVGQYAMILGYETIERIELTEN
ncbi:MAG: DUF5711 family protein [Oscillospiraceae bacterium]|nr:DUF5711 family protein [Oscillospiraceae bacterium]